MCHACRATEDCEVPLRGFRNPSRLELQNEGLPLSSLAWLIVLLAAFWAVVFAK